MITSTTPPIPVATSNEAPVPPPTTASEPVPPATSAASPPPALTAPPAQTNDDSPVSALKAMFPDFDDAVLQSVLESVNYDQDRAIDTLLGMSDPEYKPTAVPEPPHGSQGHLSQTELDEQMARQLYLEDQRQQDAARAAHQSRNQRPQHPGWNEGPYPAGYQSPPPGQERDTMAELSQQVNKFAETGKKTFQSLFSQAKAKVAEFQQNQNQPRPGRDEGYQVPGSSGSGYASYQQQPAFQQHEPPSHSFSPPAGQPASYSPPPPTQPYDAGSFSAPAPAPAAAPTTGSGPTLDASKLGMLPKRPVSLLRPNSVSTPPADGAPGHPQPIVTERDDTLEYVENPFEDQNSKRR